MSIFLLSCEKNYTCRCETNAVYPDGTTAFLSVENIWLKKTTKRNAKIDCDTNDYNYFIDDLKYEVTCEAIH